MPSNSPVLQSQSRPANKISFHLSCRRPVQEQKSRLLKKKGGLDFSRLLRTRLGYLYLLVSVVKKNFLAKRRGKSIHFVLKLFPKQVKLSGLSKVTISLLWRVRHVVSGTHLVGFFINLIYHLRTNSNTFPGLHN